MPVQYISEDYHKKIFGTSQVDTSHFKNLRTLKMYGIEDIEDPSKDSPEIKIDDRIGNLDNLLKDVSNLVYPIKLAIDTLISRKEAQVKIPKKILGWQKFYKGRWIKSQPPKGQIMILDTETVPSLDNRRWFPFLAVAITTSTVYVWWGDGQSMVPLGQGNIIVAHNANYDRAMTDCSYKVYDNNIWVDTLSLAISVRGISKQQHNLWLKKKDSMWGKAYPGGLSLDRLYKYYTGLELAKEERTKITEEGREYLEKMETSKAFSYCFFDVKATQVVLSKLWEEWREQCPSDLSISGFVLIGKERLPLAKGWDNYIKRADKIYEETLARIERILMEKATEIHELGEEKAVKDFWYAQLDWKLNKRSKRAKWYHNLIRKGITLKSKETPLILQITYEGHPVMWTNLAKPGERKNNGFGYQEDGKVVKIQNPNGEDSVVKGFFSKDFGDLLDNGVVSSAGSNKDFLTKLLKEIRSTVNWTSTQKRLKEVFYEVDENGQQWCIPDDKVIGTLTRRKAGASWPVFSNQKKGRIGTETKCYIQPPEGYKIVQTDVDSEELRLFALIGDKDAKGLSGTSPLCTTVLCGQKSKGNDVHTLVAKQLDVSRDQAKTLVYGTIYGMSLKGFQDALKLANPDWSAELVAEKAKLFQSYFKTGLLDGTPGIASNSFRALHRGVNRSIPTTPVLNSAIPKTLRGTTGFVTTRNNWLIQSSGRDFLDTMISFVWAISVKLNVDMKLFMTVHDSVHYLVKEGQEKMAAYVIAMSHLYTWALVIKNMGLKTLPKALMFPESIDVDNMVRKTPYDPCVTPSKPEESPPGYSLTAKDLV